MNESDPDFPATSGLTPNDPNGTGDNTDPGTTTIPANGVGVENSGYLSGYTSDAALGGLVWRDLDGNGIQDAGEPGIAGVTVEIYGSTDTLIDTTVTDANGNYSFNGLKEGDYYVIFRPPAGYGFSPQSRASDDTGDSDADPTSGRTSTISPRWPVKMTSPGMQSCSEVYPPITNYVCMA